jgi:thiol-disulfide isomerase/thioredoxin
MSWKEALLLTASAWAVEDDVVQTISHGAAINEREHLVRGKYTVFEFYADWCGSCDRWGPKFEAAIRKRSDMVLRRIDINSAESDVAHQYKLDSIPELIIFDPQGNVFKRGFDRSGHFILPDEFPDDGTDGGGVSPLLCLAVVLGAFIGGLFMFTRFAAPAKSRVQH